jgi:hypothetical protein
MEDGHQLLAGQHAVGELPGEHHGKDRAQRDRSVNAADLQIRKMQAALQVVAQHGKPRAPDAELQQHHDGQTKPDAGVQRRRARQGRPVVELRGTFGSHGFSLMSTGLNVGRCP